MQKEREREKDKSYVGMCVYEICTSTYIQLSEKLL